MILSVTKAAVYGGDGNEHYDALNHDPVTADIVEAGYASAFTEQGNSPPPWADWEHDDRAWSFDDLIGHDHIREALRARVIAGRTRNHVIFHGASNVGKQAIATLYGQAIVCSSPVSKLKPCRSCPACQDFETGQGNGQWYDLKEMSEEYRHSARKQIQRTSLTKWDRRTIERRVRKSLENFFIRTSKRIKEGSLFSLVTLSNEVLMFKNLEWLDADLTDRFLHALESSDAPATCIFTTADLSALSPAFRSRCQAYRVAPLNRQGAIALLSRACKRQKIASEVAVLEVIAAHAGNRCGALIEHLWTVYYSGPATIQEVKIALGLDWVEQAVDVLSAMATGDQAQVQVALSRLGNEPGEVLKRLRVTMQALNVIECMQTCNLESILPPAFMYIGDDIASLLVKEGRRAASRLGMEPSAYRKRLMMGLSRLCSTRSTSILAEILRLT